MKIKYTSLVSLMFLISVVFAQAQTPEVCNGVLQFTGRNISSQGSERSKRSFVYQKACSGKYKSADQKAKLGIDAIIEAIPVGIDAGYDNRTTKVETWCNENKEFQNEYEQASIFNNTVYAPAIAAWEACIIANNSEIRIEPTLIDDSTPQFAIENRVKGGQDIEIRGITLGSSGSSTTTCKVYNAGTESPIIVDSTADMKKAVIQPLKTANIVCTRKSENRTLDGVEQEITPEVSIGIVTSQTNYQIKLPTKRAYLVSENRMNDILNRLSNLENQISSSEGCMRINKTQICWGEFGPLTPVNPGWTRAKFLIKFSKPFAAPPTITTGMNTNDTRGSFRITGIANSTITNTDYSGDISNTEAFEFPPGKLHYIAIGLAID